MSGRERCVCVDAIMQKDVKVQSKISSDEKDRKWWRQETEGRKKGWDERIRKG